MKKLILLIIVVLCLGSDNPTTLTSDYLLLERGMSIGTDPTCMITALGITWVLEGRPGEKYGIIATETGLTLTHYSNDMFVSAKTILPSDFRGVE